MKRKSLSTVLIESAKELGYPRHTVDQLEALAVPSVREFSPAEIKKVRLSVSASQGVFAAFLNVNPSTVQKWEQGKVRPQKAALKLLNVVYAHGLDVLR